VERARITRLRALVAASAALALGGAGCADDSNAGSAVNDIVNGDAGATVTTGDEPAPEQFEIEIANFQFSPADAVIAAGTEVVWLNADTDLHSIVSTGELFATSDIFEPGQSYSVTLSEPGTYAYTCGVHPFMTGTITVE